MREIKFRAFWKNPPKMTSGFDLDDYASDQDGTYGASQYPSLFNIERGEATLMQYTGLKDKNGVEIYEGDVLSAIDSYGEKCRLSVIWYPPIAGFSLMDMERHVLFWNDIKQHEIIGNIYECPELV